MIKARHMKRNLTLQLLILILICMAATACATRSTAERNDAPPAPTNSSVTDLVARADQLYTERTDLSKTRECISVLRQARAADPNNYDAAWRLARANYFLGEHTDDSGERDKAFSAGEAAAKDAIKLSGNKPEGHFWLGANLGGQAEHSALTGLAAAEDIRREMQTVIKLDEGFMSGSAYMALGRIDIETPSMMGGDPKRAVELLEKGLKFGANNSPLRYYLAEAYIKVNRKDDARKQLEAVISMQPDPNYLPEHNDAVTKARELLKKL